MEKCWGVGELTEAQTFKMLHVFDHRFLSHGCINLFANVKRI